MRTIRTKLLVAFILMIAMLIQVAYFLHHSNQLSIATYDEMLRRFLLLNEITQMTRDISKTVSLQLRSPSPSYMADYHRLTQQLRDNQAKLDTYFTEPTNQLAIRNYKNMMTSYLERAAAVLAFRDQENTERYVAEYQELENMKRYLQEYAQSLYDIELTNYHQFYTEMVRKNAALQERSMLIIICAAGFSVLFVISMSTGIARPITQLAQAAKRSYLRDGVFHFQPVEVQSKDEVEILASAFNTMGEHIRHMVSEMNRKAELEIRLKEMELKALQNQIHPHFLFNTLNIISKLAYIEGAEQSSELMLSLSRLLRYNLRRMDAPVTLEEELNHVRQYFRIQHARFGERVCFHCEIDPSLLSMPIPCLTIQPLVENAFIHGIEQMEEGGEIVITAEVETTGSNRQKRAVIRIRDNGAGMSEATRQRLLRSELQQERPPSQGDHSTGIGFWNVSKRLHIFCQKENIEDVVQVNSVLGQGTEILLLIPLLEGEGGTR